MQDPFSKIILGTVQLGMPYGLGHWKNTLMPESEAFAILDAAWEMGITTLDTSPDYGMAEARIAKYMKAHKAKPFQIISKIKHIPVEAENVQTSFQNYFDACPFTGLDACSSLSVLLHKEADIYRPEILGELDAAVQCGLIMQWGVSVYGEAFAKDAAKIENCSLIQLPFGVLNQSFGRSGVIELLMNSGKTVMARSVFSQGLLLRKVEVVPETSGESSDLLNEIFSYLDEQDFAITDFAISTAWNESGVANLVLGADTVSQMLEWKLDALGNKQISLPAQLLTRIRQFDSNQFKPNKWVQNAK